MWSLPMNIVVSFSNIYASIIVDSKNILSVSIQVFFVMTFPDISTCNIAVSTFHACRYVMSWLLFFFFVAYLNGGNKITGISNGSIWEMQSYILNTVKQLLQDAIYNQSNLHLATNCHINIYLCFCLARTLNNLSICINPN